ncbi:MAG: family 10 glycosylhydrolase [Dysgonamonadaceae bacterium]|jgi:uncharacterized lipoprotein YddW (UPF0748 family)|nr:family 10 glycosylhydrolase [Dysgonamonadaceae bacterium]
MTITNFDILNKNYLIFIFVWFSVFCQIITAQPKQEMRAVWLTVNHNLDWPRTVANSKLEIEQQKDALNTILDKLQEVNINLVFFQTRIRGTVIYKSITEPFTTLIKSKSCRTEFDALAYAIEGCHKRGMELHAWFVVYPLGPNNKNLSKMLLQSDIVKKFKNDYYINPGNPKTVPYLVGLIKELVSEYDIDGVHFDYIRYPDGATKFPDSREYQCYGDGKSLDSWRRENINQFVYAAYDAVKALKPYVAVSSSVVGMYNRLPEVNRKHWTAYHSVYQDPVDWIKKGKHDFIVPMLYNRNELFFPFVEDWKKRCHGSSIVPGLGLYMVKESGWDADVITEQIRYLRKNKIDGYAFFRVRNLTENNEFYKILKSEYFYEPALLPVLSKNNVSKPQPPTDIYAEKQNDYLYLSWAKPDNTNDKKLFYNLYRSETFPIDIENPRNMIAVKLKKENCKIRIDNSKETVYYYAVTAYDRFHNESKISESAMFVTSEFEK